MAASSIIFKVDTLVTAFCIIGSLTLFTQIFKLIKWVWSMFLRPPKKLTHYGSWALITGSTDGIGKSISFDLASKGLNLILIGRNINKLQSTSNEICSKFGGKTKIKTVVIDFEKVTGDEIKRKIKEEIKDLEVGVLINNVGLSTNGARYFHEVEIIQGMSSLVSVNIESINWVTTAVLPAMLQRRKGAIVNIGSGSTLAVPSYPLFSIYAASKAYVAMLSRSMGVEYKQLGIDIQCQIPLLVATKMASIKRSSFFIPSPSQFSKASVRWIGYESVCVPYWTHVLQWCMLSAMPDSLVNWGLFRYFLNLRKKVLRKENKRA